MKIGPLILAVFIAGVVCWPIDGSAQAMGQAFSGAIPAVGAAGGAESDPGMTGAQDSAQFADGTRAINLGHWAEAEAIFSAVVTQHGPHAPGALYWRAYAENKLGHAGQAVTTCGELGRDYPSSSWLHECGALEIEINARSGKPIQPHAAQDDDLRLLALNSLMQQDEPRALAEIQEILNGDASEKLKKQALFILGQHYSDETYPQIVRLSYVEGDVRVARGKEAEKTTGAEWEQAVTNLPIETGFSLATGEGRAEIELEDASTLYLAENSVLTFNDLHTSMGVPYTEVALLAGAATVDARPYVAGELFLLKTPTDDLTVRYPFRLNARVNSYLDGTAITPQSSVGLRLPQTTPDLIAQGQTLTLRQGHRIEAVDNTAPGAFAAWDQWVTNRLTERTAAINDVMKASGLAQPIPGIAEMKGQGRFFDCAPYGTCWEPNAEPGGPREGGIEANTETERAPSAATGAGQQTGNLKQAAAKARKQPLVDDEFFPCFPPAFRYGLVTQLADATQQRMLYPNMGAPYDWALCHAGTWIRHNRHYVWVAGHKRHHHEPGRWVKSGRAVAFVPLHPYDVKGRPPINQKEDVFGFDPKRGNSFVRLRLDPGRPIEILKSPPREFAREFLPPLPRATEPHLEAHTLKEPPGGSKGIGPRGGGVPLTFDHKLQSFNLTRQVVEGNRTVTIAAPISNHTGTLQSHGGGFGGFGGNSGGAHNSGGSGGGGTHVGGGTSTSSSGGSHSGGSSSGASASPSTSSSSSSSSSSGGSSGGSSPHH